MIFADLALALALAPALAITLVVVAAQYHMGVAGSPFFGLVASVYLFSTGGGTLATLTKGALKGEVGGRLLAMCTHKPMA